mmetsp:Transcript_30571/g.87750  ORF Transcript_30571/g.87750 Transcript_30571/m.87750 type:complete len:218 (+) Transcript_30571:1104-1757(+)
MEPERAPARLGVLQEHPDLLGYAAAVEGQQRLRVQRICMLALKVSRMCSAHAHEGLVQGHRPVVGQVLGGWQHACILGLSQGFLSLVEGDASTPSRLVVPVVCTVLLLVELDGTDAFQAAANLRHQSVQLLVHLGQTNLELQLEPPGGSARGVRAGPILVLHFVAVGQVSNVPTLCLDIHPFALRHRRQRALTPDDTRCTTAGHHRRLSPQDAIHWT